MQYENYPKIDKKISELHLVRTDGAARISVDFPQLLQIRNGRSISYGAHQVWYHNWLQRLSGCGPTAASNLLWYLSATRPETCGGLFQGNGTDHGEMIELMEEVWKYVKPGRRGVDKPSIFTDGAVRYGRERGVSLETKTLEIPPSGKIRPTEKEVLGFLTYAFSRDLPAAFLNLSNGAVKNLDKWHWVTLVSVDEILQAEMYDQGERQNIDLKLWLATATAGGAFVIVEPSGEERSH